MAEAECDLHDYELIDQMIKRSSRTLSATQLKNLLLLLYLRITVKSTVTSQVFRCMSTSQDLNH